MTTPDPWRIFLAAEGPSDRRRIGILVDHFLLKRSRTGEDLDDLRVFEAVDGHAYVRVKDIPALARACELDRRYAKGDGDSLRKLYQILIKKKLLRANSVIIWGRDDDGDHTRRRGATEERNKLPNNLPILLAIASECGEAWVIAGWPIAIKDKNKLKKWRQDLGFHAHEHPDRLSHKENVPKSAKAILEDIFSGNQDKEAEALIAAAESRDLASRLCGLADFCDEIEAWLSKIAVGHPSAGLQEKFTSGTGSLVTELSSGPRKS